MTYTDIFLENKIRELENAVQEWAELRELWFDCSFASYLKHVDGEPDKEYPVVTILCTCSMLSDVLDGSSCDEWQKEFNDIVESFGFQFENINGYNFHFYPTAPDLITAFGEYFHWQWVCSLIQQDFGDVYEELYDYFAKKPERLRDISWREYEILLFRIFQQQGFNAELGPGSGDGGVDIRLLSRDPLGDMLTLVQAKKYNPKNKIQLEAVAALHGVADIEKAQSTIFITTSEYAPVAKNFAARTSGRMELKTSEDVSAWCKAASNGIVVDKASLVARDSVAKIVLRVSNKRDERIVHSTSGYNMTFNHFALVLKETKYAALLMVLPRHVVSDDGYGQMGSEIPVLGPGSLVMHKAETVWRAKRQVKDGRVMYWDGYNSYSPWSGEPMRFNYVD